MRDQKELLDKGGSTLFFDYLRNSLENIVCKQQSADFCYSVEVCWILQKKQLLKHCMMMTFRQTLMWGVACKGSSQVVAIWLQSLNIQMARRWVCCWCRQGMSSRAGEGAEEESTTWAAVLYTSCLQLHQQCGWTCLLQQAQQWVDGPVPQDGGRMKLNAPLATVGGNQFHSFVCVQTLVLIRRGCQISLACKIPSYLL